VRYWFALLAWILVIFLFSTNSFSSAQTSKFFVPALKFAFPFLSPEQLQVGHIIFRKAGHVSEYFVLGFLAWRALRSANNHGIRLWLLSAGLVLLVALSDEFHQSFVPSRVSSIVDVGYDCVGGIAALVVLSRFRNETRTIYSHPVL